jgi:hypothetical protein
MPGLRRSGREQIHTASTWALKLVSDSRIPETNAPSVSENPAFCVNRDAPVTDSSASEMNTSSDLDVAATSNTRRKNVRPPSNTCNSF